ncbi:transcriptional regulator, TetR family [Thiohalospira halophila DSM 15071]|uniref:Nucleoid occlusion factor SlmA n=1 Tax=Thiohalospira halophila DSM 15071 TaxID=1123397 RepID=A0A1I1SKL4_9GAMM|nr:nucleoid occlusion factor SlmA [Thiohalospira halophila]SFD47019.1 transcriptional regulator, TetR family [Thiohalospira halophila DSM 15071]
MSEEQTGSSQRGNRRQEILETLARILEEQPGERITTAGLARAVGVSEAALYRHFPSKGKMFEALIEFAEEAVFGLINRILEEHDDPADRCERIMGVLLGFAQRNPGITRVLLGEALVGEVERLRQRVDGFYDRLETRFKQILREGEGTGHLPVGSPATASANLLVSVAEGRMRQFLRSGFQRQPLEHWEQQWGLLAVALFPNRQ